MRRVGSEGGSSSGTPTRNLDNITASNLNLSSAEALWAKSLIEYSRDPMKQLKADYGDRWPGSHQRWVDQTAERESIERSYRRQRAWALYRRVHGEPCAGELARLAFEQSQKDRYAELAKRRPAIPKGMGVLAYHHWLAHREPEAEPEADCVDCPEEAA